MIIVRLRGRLGNHLFQIATAKSLTDDVRVVFSSDFSKEDFYKYKDSLFSTIKIASDDDCLGLPVIEEKSYAFSPFPNKMPESFVLEGYFQSFKYFDSQKISVFFKCPDNVVDDLNNRYGHLDPDRTVSINVRRGDYLKFPHRHPFCGLEYYLKAIKRFPKDSVFVVSSDDIAWCKKNFTNGNFVFQENSYPLLDLYVQSYCKHNILSNSSFSWWGAMFNTHGDKIVIVPKEWYGIRLRHLAIDDLIPATYEKIGIKQSTKDRVHALLLCTKEWMSDQIKRIHHK